MPPSFSVTLAPQDWSFETADGQSLLIAAQQAGVRLPSSCRNGTCRTCMCRMAAGSIRYGVEWPGLSREEKLDGYILPCVAFAESDVTLEVRGVKLS